MSFPTTRWTVLANATLDGDASGQQALADMCADYRRPVEVFLATRGYRPQDVPDLVQDFFLRWLKSRAWKRADRARGRFRTFLLGAVVHMLAHARERKQAQKRGGGRESLSLDELAETGMEFSEEQSASDASAFDREWAHTVIRNTLGLLKREHEAQGRAGAFEVLRHFLPGADQGMSLDLAAQELGTNTNAMKASVHRLRVRFREMLRAMVASTVSAPHEVDEELLYLRSLLISQPILHTSGVERRNT